MAEVDDIRTVSFTNPFGEETIMPLNPGQTAQEQAIISMAIMGRTHADIAAQVQCSEALVHKTLSKPEAKAHITACRTGAYNSLASGITQLNMLIADAVNVVRQKLKSEDEKVQLAAAKMVLSRLGDLPVTPPQQQSETEALSALKDAAASFELEKLPDTDPETFAVSGTNS